jgi:single-stranded DNA-binding protein
MPEVSRTGIEVPIIAMVFGAQARPCAQHLARVYSPATASTVGSRVVVEAEPDWRAWTDQQGAKREAVTFRARQVLFEGSRRAAASEGEGEGSSSPAQPAVETGVTVSASDGPASADDLSVLIRGGKIATS